MELSRTKASSTIAIWTENRINNNQIVEGQNCRTVYMLTLHSKNRQRVPYFMLLRMKMFCVGCAHKMYNEIQNRIILIAYFDYFFILETIHSVLVTINSAIFLSRLSSMPHVFNGSSIFFGLFVVVVICTFCFQILIIIEAYS